MMDQEEAVNQLHSSRKNSTLYSSFYQIAIICFARGKTFLIEILCCLPDINPIPDHANFVESQLHLQTVKSDFYHPHHGLR